MQQINRRFVASAIGCLALVVNAKEQAAPSPAREAPPLRFGYTGFFVENVPATVAFYEAAFGIPLKYMHPSKGYAELDTGATRLAFVSEAFIEEQHLLAQIKPRVNRATAEPIAAQVAFISHDIERDWARAVSAGAKVLKLPELKPWGQTAGYLLDSNGVIVELCTPSPRQ